MKKKPVSVEIQDEADGRFVILTYANGEVIRERVDPRVELVGAELDMPSYKWQLDQEDQQP